MGLAGIEPTNDRLRPEDWRDKYRYPDPTLAKDGKMLGWTGGLAGYLPDHPIRRGVPCPPGVVYPDDPWYAPPPGKEGKCYDSAKVGGKPPWCAGYVPPPINTPEEKARKLKVGLAVPGVKRASSLLDDNARDNAATQDDNDDNAQAVITPKKKPMTAYERLKAHRARKRGE